MELYQLRTFITVTEEQSISGAARRLSMTPSSISTHIKALETELGVQLFIRTHQGVQVTEKGLILAEHARQTIQAAEGLSQQATALKQRLVGTVRLGVSVPKGVFELSIFLQCLNATYPEIEVILTQSETAPIIQYLLDEKLDVAVVFGDVGNPLLKTHTLSSAELVIAIPKAWADKIESLWESLADLTWINTGLDCPFQSIIDSLCQTYRIQPKQFIRTNHEQTRRDLVCAGMGISILEKSEASHPDIIIFDNEPMSCPVSLVYPSHRQFNPIIQAVCDILMETRP